MKKIIIILCIVTFFCCAGFAENKETAKWEYKFTNGGFWSCGQNFAGGFGEFGFNLLSEENNFLVRDCIFIQGQGGYLAKNDSLEYGALEIGNKLIFGGKSNCDKFIIRSYGFAAGGVGLYICEGHKIFSMPLLIDLSFGGGFEFQYTRHMAFVIEFGGTSRMFVGKNRNKENNISDYSKSTPSLTIGFRSFK